MAGDQNECGIEKKYKNIQPVAPQGIMSLPSNVHPVLILLLHGPNNFMLFIRFLEFFNSWKFDRSNVWFIKHNIA